MYLKEGLELQVPQQAGTACTLSEVCRGRLTIVKVMRRFGCPLTRHEAREISQYSEELEKMGVGLVGVGFDTAGVSGFGMGGFWNGELFLDEERGVYDFFGLGRMSKLNSLRILLHKETRHIISNAKNACRGNTHGDRFQLGGTFVIDKAGQVVFSHIQADILDYSPMDDIIEVCQNEILRSSRIEFGLSRAKSKKTPLYKGPHYKKQNSFPVPVQKYEYKKQSSFPGFKSANGSLRYILDDSTTNSTCSLETTLEEPDFHTYAFDMVPDEGDKECYFSNHHLFQTYHRIR